MTIIDAFAGAGRYHLALDDRAMRGGEWQGGVGRVWPDLQDDAPAAFKPYFSLLTRLNPNGLLHHYPGSPLIAAAFARADDKVLVNELHREERATLTRTMAPFPHARVYDMDGWQSIRAFLPPMPRRGVLLIDPPFEEAGEFARLRESIRVIRQIWKTGVTVLWYPLTPYGGVSAFSQELIQVAGDVPTLQLELILHPPEERGLYGSGLVILNPPYGLEEDAREIGSTLEAVFHADPGYRQRWIVSPD
ncbi:MAG: 23S rRNA (adenine(2030)-N(6))-methyltransferase RlmJ [Neomegalonema sp.]|nr:23S rRNA (adenine(2030)-N(6))-methyltransferase RlmJ [Neomegalonema sp.]